MSDPDLTRERLRRSGRTPGVRPEGPGGSPAFVGRVVTPSPAAGKFVTVNPVTVLGDEVIGGAGELAVDASSAVPIYLVGNGVPSTGDDLVCRFVDFRWVAERGAGCAILVRPTTIVGGANVPIVGAVVTVFWNAATRGAFLDPGSNDSHSADFTTTSEGVKVPVPAANGIYVVRVVASGHATTHQFVWACGASCANPLLGHGRVYTPGAAPVLTGATITTNVQTVPLVDSNFRGGTSAASISGVITTILGGGLPTVSGGMFALSPGPPDCDAGLSEGTPGFISVGCVSGGSGIAVVASVMLTVCPDCHSPYSSGDCTTPTNYSSNYGGFSSPAVLRSRVSSIEYLPTFRVRGVWDSAYSFGGIYASHAGGLALHTLSVAGPALTPLHGDFVIEG